MSSSPDPEPGIGFSATRGGPSYALQRQLGLITDNDLHIGRRILLFTGLAWAVPLLLTAVTALSGDLTPLLSYLGDPGTWAKFLIAISAYVLAEKFVEQGLRDKLTQFTRAPIITPHAIPQAKQAGSDLLRRTNSGRAELVCIVLAYGASLVVFRHLILTKTPSWAVQIDTAGNHVTLAGWWMLLVSLPLFMFLLFRSIWRHYLWSCLLRRIAGLELRLVATHPDKCGGLAFLSTYPTSYIFFVFGTSVALAAALLKNQHLTELTATTFTIIVVGWTAVVIAFFAFALMAFSRPLAELKKVTRTRAAAQATRFWRQAERKTLGQNSAADAGSEEEGETVAEIPDPAKYFDGAEKLSTVLLSHKAAIPIIAAALLPMVAVGAANLPFKEVLEVLKKLIVL